MNLRLLIRVVFLGAAVLASSLLGVGADVSIGSSFEIGTLQNVSELFAMFELGNSLNQGAWRQLRDETWHESAFRSFFAVGSLDANQMNALAEQNNKPDTWKSSNVNIKATSDLMARLQAISTTHYHIHRSITGTGDIEASVWTLMFSCGSTSCIDGYMVPILAVPADTEQGNTILYSYVTAWLPVTDGVLMNAIPASISKNATQTIEEDNLNQPASIHFKIQAYLPPCPKARVHSFRTLLDSAYGLAPALTCIGFSDDDADSFKVIVTNGSTDGRTWKQVLESQLELSLLIVSDDQWLQQPLEKCFQRPLLILPEGSADNLPHMCHHNKCMVFVPKDNNSTSQIQTGLQFLKGLEKVLDEGPSQCNNFPICDGLYNISRFYDLDSTDLEPLTSSFRRSDWASGEGKNTSEFYYAPHRENLTACAIELTAPSSKLKPPVEIHIQAIDYLTAFITEHNTAFTTAEGPATDPYTFYALLITTALSVITITVPLTNFILEVICRVRPVYFNIQKGKGAAGGAYMASKVLIQVCCNVGLTIAFFLPVLSLAKNEMDRQIKFSTWAIASDDLVEDDFSPAPIRVVYLFDVTSQYHSKFLGHIVLVTCITCLFVAVCTAWRCLQVFARYQLLLPASVATDTTFSNSSAIMHALKAIEMGDAEFLELKLKTAEGGG